MFMSLFNYITYRKCLDPLKYYIQIMNIPSLFVFLNLKSCESTRKKKPTSNLLRDNINNTFYFFLLQLVFFCVLSPCTNKNSWLLFSEELACTQLGSSSVHCTVLSPDCNVIVRTFVFVG